jgi:sugar transferase (PEP-CTERM/EpsH1 system associated)
VRILFVTPYVPSRIRVRPFNLIKMLSKTHEIALVSLVVDDYERALVRDVEQYCVSVDLVDVSRWQGYARCLLALPTIMPLRIAFYRSPVFARRIKEVISRQKIDVVHGELIKVVPALKTALEGVNIPVLYDSVDCISWYLRQTLDTARNPLKKVFIYSEWQKVRRFEQNTLASFDQLIISSARDRDCLGELVGSLRSIEVVSNGVDTSFFTARSGVRAVDSLVFCAKLDYFPNAQAILHFCENILPLIWEQRQQARLTIVGNKPPKAVRALAADARITVTGYVPDTRPYLETASVALAPLMVAAGMQNKILEALAMSVPMVTTPRCARALNAEDGVHLLVAAEPRAFAEAVVRLLNDREYADQLGAAGRQFVIERYSWTEPAAVLSKLYDAIALAPDRQEASALLAGKESNVKEKRSGKYA